MKRVTIEQLAVFVLLVSSAIALRLYFRDIPNFAPVASVALFAGFYFRSWFLAVATSITVMAVTDYFIGSYQPLLQATVYAMLTVPVLLRGRVRRWLSAGIGARAAIYVASSTLVCSLLFFLVTNFATWWVTPWYDRTLAGMVQCFVNAIPFFRYTLIGDMAFTTVLFGAYLTVVSLVPRSARPVLTR